jgi:hypothetical protein
MMRGDGEHGGGASHDCVACRDMVTPGRRGLRFGRRYQGPPGNVNGGVVIGALTCLARSASGLADASVAQLRARLHKGIPQARDLTVDTAVDGAEVDLRLSDGDTLLATATMTVVGSDELRAGRRPVVFDAERIEPLRALTAPTQAQRDFAARHPHRSLAGSDSFSECFVCGADNAEGLRVRAETMAEGLAWAANPAASAYAEADGRLDTVIAVASLDCPAVPCTDALDVLAPDESVLLGSFTAEFLAVPPASVPGGYRLPSRFVRREGRRVSTDIALTDAEGNVYAVADATWVTVPRPALPPT